MVAKNDITGDSIQTKGVSDKYRDNYDLIFRKKKEDNTGVTQNTYAAKNIIKQKNITE